MENWWRITCQRRHGEKRWRRQTSCDAWAGQLTLVCGSAMVLSQFVMGEDAEACFLSGLYSNSDVDATHVLFNNMIVSPLFSSLQCSVVARRTPRAISLLSGHINSSPRDAFHFRAAAAVCSLTEHGSSRCFPACDLVEPLTDLLSAVLITRVLNAW